MKWLALALMLVAAQPAAPTPSKTEQCFLLFEDGVGEIRRNPSASCTTRMSPQSTFKIPHAVAALDSAVIEGADTVVKYNGAPVDQALWRRDHSLATAIRYSVVWYFQEIARRLGAERERAYLERFDYGNRDPSSGLTTFWLGGSLAISPEEELQFLRKLYGGDLPVSKRAVEQVRAMLVQPAGVVVNATGEHPFVGPWSPGTVVSAKTGAGTDRTGREIRWLVGQVQRGARRWFFVSNIIGPRGLPAMAAVDLAASSLREARVLP